MGATQLAHHLAILVARSLGETHRSLLRPAVNCAWFDEKDYFEFFPLQAIRAKSSQAHA
jgi:hypothetical protein